MPPELFCRSTVLGAGHEPFGGKRQEGLEEAGFAEGVPVSVDRPWPGACPTWGFGLEARLSESECDHTLRFTREWLQTASSGETKGAIDALRNRGGYCDCEVFHNV